MGEGPGNLFVLPSQVERSEIFLFIGGKERHIKEGDVAFGRVLGRATVQSFGLFLTGWTRRSLLTMGLLPAYIPSSPAHVNSPHL